MKETKQTIDQKIIAAQILGLIAEKNYKKMGDLIFLELTVKAKERVFLLELDKDEQLAIWSQAIILSQAQITDIQKNIDKINTIE